MKHGQDPRASTSSPAEDRPVTLPPGIPATGRTGRDPQAHADAPGIGGQQSDPGQPGTCYLLHFSQPYKHARHYSGTAADLQARLAEHQAGRGSRLLAVVKAAGITWTLARTWPGGRARERQLKNQGGASRRCPECGVKPRNNPGERKEAAGMKQPPEQDTSHAQGMTAHPERGATTWARTQLRDQIQRTAPGPETGQTNGEQVRQGDHPAPADRGAERARTAAPDYAQEPSTGPETTSAGGRAADAARRAEEHARAARSVDCECQAQAGTPCEPAGDHLARYLRAHQTGALTRDSLARVITGLDVIAPRALIQPPGEQAAPGEAARTAGHTGRGQASSGMNADQAGGRAHSVPGGRSGAPALAGQALRRGGRGASALCARQEPELEAGS
jgi:predicted GIY-YIG superfamily endonuclease